MEELRQDGQNIQIIITTHSPNLASAIRLDNLVLLNEGRSYPLARGQTALTESDYGFLARFLDTTKANLFFARGILIVEGDAENIVLPTIAKLLKRNLTEYGVSIVNVGGVGLRRFARIYQRKSDKEKPIGVLVACIADLDVMPDCAPEILGRVKSGEALPDIGSRRWRTKADFAGTALADRRAGIQARASGQRVETFVADEWTLEYDLAFAGLAEDVWVAAYLADADESISKGSVTRDATIEAAKKSFAELQARKLPADQLASYVYAKFDSGASKAVAAQHLSILLEERVKTAALTPAVLRTSLPRYLVSAIEYVTEKIPAVTIADDGDDAGKIEEASSAAIA